MSLQELLSGIEKQMGTEINEEQVIYPTTKLRHEMLRITKDKVRTYVRILPPTQNAENFIYPYRNFFMQTTNENGKDLRMNVILPAEIDPQDPVEQQINQWIQIGKVPNQYGSKPSMKYFMNVNILQLTNDGQLIPETDENGNLVVRVLDAPFTLFSNILELLQSPFNQPEGATDGMGAISELDAYPFELYRQKESSGVKYYANLINNKPLGRLPQGWENFAEDLAYQATPTSEYNGDFLEYMIKTVNNKIGLNTAQPRQANNNFNQPQQPTKNFNQPVSQQQANNNFSQQQPTQQPTNNFNQQNQQQAPPTNNNFNQPQAQPQTPQAQTNEPEIPDTKSAINNDINSFMAKLENIDSDEIPF